MRTPNLTSKSLLLLSLLGALSTCGTSTDKPTGTPGIDQPAATDDQNKTSLAELFHMEEQYREKVERWLSLQRELNDPSNTEMRVEQRRQQVEVTMEIGQLNRKIIASRLQWDRTFQQWENSTKSGSKSN